ncbi:hypothetical protein ID866_7862 [Astraeus odoratus]|nr:hypothetical protein ID866_7862 [Astraeus odoratus]
MLGWQGFLPISMQACHDPSPLLAGLPRIQTLHKIYAASSVLRGQVSNTPILWMSSLTDVSHAFSFQGDRSPCHWIAVLP